MQINNSFHQYGLISVLYKYIVVIFCLLFYGLRIAYIYKKQFYLLQYMFQLEMIIFLITLIYSIWRVFFAEKIISLSMSPIEEYLDIFTKIIFNLILIIMPLCIFSAYSIAASLNFIKDINNSYEGFYIYNVMIIPSYIVRGYGSFLISFTSQPENVNIFLERLHELLSLILLPIIIIIRVIYILYNQIFRGNSMLSRNFKL